MDKDELSFKQQYIYGELHNAVEEYGKAYKKWYENLYKTNSVDNFADLNLCRGKVLGILVGAKLFLPLGVEVTVQMEAGVIAVRCHYTYFFKYDIHEDKFIYEKPLDEVLKV